MAVAYTPVIPSASTNGRGIKIVQTASAGDTLHTCTSTSGEMDEVWVWVQNTHSAPVAVTIQLGGTTAPDDSVTETIPTGAGLYLMVPGRRLNGGVVVKAFAGTANVCVAHVNVNRIAVT